MGYTPIPATFSAHTPPRPKEKRLYLATPKPHSHKEDTLKVNPDRPPKQKVKDYSELFGKPGSALFGTGNGRGGGGEEKHPFDASTWVPPPSPSSIRPGNVGKRRDEEEVPTAGLGYFAFPPSGSIPRSLSNASQPQANAHAKTASESASTPTHHSTFSSSSQPRKPISSQPKTPSSSSSDTNIWDTDRLAALHRARLAREALEAQKGEEYWVSCGGVLRDENGKRDLARTKKVKEELELREKERKLLEVWEEYERRWAEMVRKVRGGGSKRERVDAKGKGKGKENGREDEMQGIEEEDDGSSLKFDDIPWPIHTAFTKPPPPPSPSSLTRFSSLSFKPSAPPPTSPYPPPPERILADLTPANIKAFLLDPLTVRGTKVSARERIRSSMLRWHPDKMGGVVERVRDEEEREMVVRGVHEVVRALQGLLGEVGRERNGQGV